MRVQLFATCLPASLFPDTATAAKRVLSRFGCEVETREAAVCCGQPAWNSGHLNEARKVAQNALRALDGDDPIVMCSGSCAAMVHEYWPELFAGTELQHAATNAAARVREFSTFVADDIGADALTGAHLDPPLTAAYHDSCHMTRMLGAGDAPRRLLAAIDGLTVRPLTTPERCCGFGGTFSIRYPELSVAMADEKVNDVTAKGVSVLIAADSGCLMQICSRAAARHVPLEGRHISEVIDAASADG
jgi:L-lactate dehydrogenase complex protein LldE